MFSRVIAMIPVYENDRPTFTGHVQRLRVLRHRCGHTTTIKVPDLTLRRPRPSEFSRHSRRRQNYTVDSCHPHDGIGDFVTCVPRPTQTSSTRTVIWAQSNILVLTVFVIFFFFENALQVKIIKTKLNLIRNKKNAIFFFFVHIT